jgi:hypothetical protein
MKEVTKFGMNSMSLESVRLRADLLNVKSKDTKTG